MIRPLLMALLSASVLIACGSKMDANESNFSAALDQYFEKKGDLCLEFRSWPVDITEFELRMQEKMQGGIAAQMAALEAAGLVKGETIVLRSQGWLGNVNEQKVRHYTLAPGAQPFVREREVRSIGLDGTTTSKRPYLCWGKKSLAKIVKWEGPRADGQYQEAIVTYTYEIDNLAEWAKKPELQQAFAGLKQVIGDAGSKHERHVVKLTSEGWEAKGLDDWL